MTALLPPGAQLRGPADRLFPSAPGYRWRLPFAAANRGRPGRRRRACHRVRTMPRTATRNLARPERNLRRSTRVVPSWMPATSAPSAWASASCELLASPACWRWLSSALPSAWYVSGAESSSGSSASAAASVASMLASSNSRRCSTASIICGTNLWPAGMHCAERPGAPARTAFRCHCPSAAVASNAACSASASSTCRTPYSRLAASMANCGAASAATCSGKTSAM
mmetsp:Transcript_12485/g.31971  ORF Transcript_12485/g.31971 Transcript_12485/m.31971 type:complete len:226 (-) Transcript_12485:586-1263(-)